MTVEEIKKLQDGEGGQATLAVANSEVRQTKTQKDFLSLTFVDKTGSIKAKVWDWNTSTEEVCPGTVWEIKFEYSPFKGSPQLVVRKFREIPRENVDKGLFIDSLTPGEFAHFRDLLEGLIRRIKDKALSDFVRFTLTEYYPSFLTSTGARSNHHNRLGGLLEHSCQVASGAYALGQAYQGTPKYDLIDFDLLIAGALLHDLAKIDTYTTENLILEYSLQGTLISDYDLSPAYLREAWIANGKPISELRLLGLQHILCSHHGKEFSNKPPSTFSAWLVHAADISDAYTDKVAVHMPEGIMGTENVWSFGNKIVDERKLV
jgi:3'-5' exoribonuclease